MTEVPISTTKGKILVIDDEVEIRESLELLLTSEGYDLSIAENGTQGIARLEDGHFDLVLLSDHHVAQPICDSPARGCRALPVP